MDTNKAMTPDPRALAIGMITGALIGFLVWMSTELFVFFPVLLAIGTTLGIAWTASERSDAERPDAEAEAKETTSPTR